jgi:signal transduction histidine kinase
MADNFDLDIAAVQAVQAIPTILDIVCRTTGMRFAAVARVTEERWIACSVRDDIAFGLQPGGELKVESTICHEIRQSGRAVVIDHVAADPRYASHHTPQIYGLQSYISMPIFLSNRVFFGTLCAIDPAPNRLNTPETIQMFEMFANVIGFHLSAVDRLELSEANLRVERKEAALREEFIAVLGHDLRNPLAAINGAMQMLQKRPLDDKASRLVQMTRRSVDRMAGLIDNVMDFTRGRLGGGLTLDIGKDDTLLEPMLRQVVAELQATAPDRVIHTDFRITAPVRCDTRRLGQLASNLLGNALTYGAADRPVRMSASAGGSVFELHVANAGPPIPPRAMETLFQPFTRGVLGSSLQGLGLGLYISHEIAKAHGGTLGVASTEDETRFTFRMPIA